MFLYFPQTYGYLPTHTFIALKRLEGSTLVTDLNDPGAPSKYGWTLTTYRKLVKYNASVNNIRNLSSRKADALYYRYFWKPNNLDKIRNNKLATTLFFAIINTSPKVPIKILQKMTNKFCPLKIKFHGKIKNYYLDIDGILGTETLYRVNHCKYLWPGYPYLLYYAYSKSKRYAKVWKWAHKGLTNRIFYEINWRKYNEKNSSRYGS